MSRLFLGWVLLLWLAPCCGQGEVLRGLDLQPLTALPWEGRDEVEMEEVLKRIFLEPDTRIRDAVLVAYFERVPVELLGAAFERCLVLEGLQQPTRLVDLLLPEWAARDPQGAWQRTKELLLLKGPDWLNLDSWSRPKIEVTDRAALQASPFWLDGGLESFPDGIDRCELARDERVAILTEFAARYIKIYGHLPNKYVGQPNEGRPPWEEFKVAFQWRPRVSEHWHWSIPGMDGPRR